MCSSDLTGRYQSHVQRSEAAHRARELDRYAQVVVIPVDRSGSPRGTATPLPTTCRLFSPPHCFRRDALLPLPFEVRRDDHHQQRRVSGTTFVERRVDKTHTTGWRLTPLQASSYSHVVAVGFSLLCGRRERGRVSQHHDIGRPPAVCLSRGVGLEQQLTCLKSSRGMVGIIRAGVEAAGPAAAVCGEATACNGTGFALPT